MLVVPGNISWYCILPSVSTNFFPAIPFALPELAAGPITWILTIRAPTMPSRESWDPKSRGYSVRVESRESRVGGAQIEAMIPRGEGILGRKSTRLQRKSDNCDRNGELGG